MTGVSEAVSAPSAAHLQLQGKSRPPWARILPAAAVYVALFVVLALYAYWKTFANWATFDDEGFFVYSLKTFVDGHTLYGSVYSEYGPFYYAVFGSLFKLTGVAVTEDIGRFITIFCWLASSFLLGLVAHRFTRSAWIGLATVLGSYVLLATFPSGPMHPQILVCLLTAMVGAFVLLGWPRFDRAAPFIIGALVAAVALTKINVGVYACVATAFVFALAYRPHVTRRWLLGLMTAVFVLLGPVLMRSQLHITPERNYALSYMLSAGGLAVVAWPRAGGIGGVSVGQMLWWVAGLVAGVCATFLVVLILGVSLSAWFQETISTPLNQGKFLSGSLLVSNFQVGVGILAVVAAALTRLPASRIRRSVSTPGWFTAVARGVIGLGIIVAAMSVFPFEHQSYPYELAWPCVWVIVVPPLPKRRAQERFARLMLAAIAISQSLMAYPVASSQIPLGDLLFVLCGAVAFGDAVSELRSLSRAERLPVVALRQTLGRRSSALAIAALAIVLVFAFQRDVGGQLKPAQQTYTLFGAPIQGYGSARTRIANPWDSGINSVIAKVRREHCRYLMEVPGIYSFNLWTRLDTPDPLTGQQPYWESLTASQQLQVLRAARAAPGLCLIRDQAGVTFYMQDQPIPKVPLMNYLANEFKRVGRYAEWTVWIRKTRG